MVAPHFQFNIGDRVQFFTYDPMLNGKRGVIEGRYGRHDNIPRKRDTVVATTPWTELMYTVYLDDQDPATDDPVIVEESDLRAITT